MKHMDKQAEAGAAVKVPPPLVYLAAVAAGVGLQLVWPLPGGLARAALIALALCIAVPGVLLVGGALRLFRETEQDPKPWLATPAIITGGVYRYTRNPMYLGLAVLQLAIGVGLGNPWIVLLVPLSCAIVHITAIRPEEAYLEQKFGATYLEYKRAVRRWL